MCVYFGRDGIWTWDGDFDLNDFSNYRIACDCPGVHTQGIMIIMGGLGLEKLGIKNY